MEEEVKKEKKEKKKTTNQNSSEFIFISFVWRRKRAFSPFTLACQDRFMTFPQIYSSPCFSFLFPLSHYSIISFSLLQRNQRICAFVYNLMLRLFLHSFSATDLASSFSVPNSRALLFTVDFGTGKVFHFLFLFRIFKNVFHMFGC